MCLMRVWNLFSKNGLFSLPNRTYHGISGVIKRAFRYDVVLLNKIRIRGLKINFRGQSTSIPFGSEPLFSDIIRSTSHKILWEWSFYSSRSLSYKSSIKLFLEEEKSNHYFFLVPVGKSLLNCF